MSAAAVEDVFGRAMTNGRFREQLLTDPDTALDGYDLTGDERTHVLKWTHATFDNVRRNIEAQLDDAGFDGAGFLPSAEAGAPPGAAPAVPRGALRRFMAGILPELPGEPLPLHAPPWEATLRQAGIIRSLEESSLPWGDLRLHLCSGLYGGPAADDHYVLPEPFGGRGLTPSDARASAVAEAAERVAATIQDDRRFVHGSAHDLAGDASPPSTFALFSDSQYAEPGFPYARFDDDTRINWTWGQSLLARRRVLVPAAFVHRPYWCGGHDARLADMPTTGLACGRSLEEAALNGLYEVIEREAIMIAWLNRLAVPRLDSGATRWASVPAIAASGRTLSLHDITTDLGIPVRLALLINRSSHIVCAGAACRLDPLAAADKAAAEAVALEPAVANTRSRRQPPADDEVRTLDDHLLYYSRADRMHELDFLVQAPTAKAGDVSRRVRRSAVEELALVLHALQQRALDPIVVDLTIPEVAAAGLWVVRAIVPGLIPLTFGRRLAPRGGARLYHVPVDMGYRTTALREDELNPAPHPFA